MPRRISISSGDGIICFEGAGMTDSQLRVSEVERGAPRGNYGCSHEDEQLNALLDCLGVSRTSEDRALIKSELDEFREFWMKCVMRDGRRSPRRERNAALSALIKSLSKSIANFTTLLKYQTLTFIGSNYDSASPFSIFNAFPFKLNELALRLEAQTEKGAVQLALSRPHRTCVTAAAAAALDVAKRLQCLDSDSQNAILGRIRWTNDYHVESIAMMIDVLNRVRSAAEKAHVLGRKPGPQRSDEFDQLILWLARLYQSCGNDVTHTPYKKGADYDGLPHSTTGTFMLTFFAFCNPELRPQAISTALAILVKRRHLI
jgi:hypothetical protein